MKHKKVKLGAALLLGLGITALHAQVAVPTSGGNAAGTGGSVSYTVGQIIYTSVAGTTGSLEQGVQQPYKITLVTGLEGTEGITLLYTAYPNPTTNFITLKVEDFKTAGLTYHLIDLTGKQLETKKVKAVETSIDMSDMAPAVYLLKVVDDHREVRTFKIFKSN